MKYIFLVILLLCVILPTVSIADELVYFSSADETVELSFPSGVNESTLTEKYITSSLPARRTLFRSSRPSGLIRFPEGTANRKLYLALRNEITLTANGTNYKQYDDDIGGMSTVFGIPAADIFPNVSFSASDLGVDALFDMNGAVMEEAEAAFWNQVDAMKAEISFSEVAWCIINDSPYELYWFGRTALILGNSFTMQPHDTELVLEGSYHVLFNVNADYAVDNETIVIDGTEYRTWIDTDKYGSVERAKNKIQAIRDAAAGMTDEEKLSYFAGQICSLVSYNSEAETEFNLGTREYGDPWQLVWVFDEMSEQQVVCEGYSKAFAYLCELCTSEAEAIIVWGSIPAGKHMWNIVSISGHNYLADLTHYDAGFDVFMVGADGSVADGYDTKALKGYEYNRKQTKRSDAELTIEPYSYDEWKEATTSAPVMQISSDCTYPGYQVAVKVESCNGVLPVESMIIHTGDEEETILLADSTVLLSITEDTECSIAGVVDGITTPVAETIHITVAEEPGAMFSLPIGASIESEAFSGIAAGLIRIHDNQVAAGSFDPDVVLAVDSVGEWFGTGYRFVVE